MGCLRGGLPMWTSKNRVRYKRDHLRYPSDVTDEEWAHIGPLIPPAKRGGRKREVDPRDVVDGIMYVLSTGCQWRYIPRTCRRAAPCIGTSVCGGTTAPWIASTTRFTRSVASRRDAKPVPPPPSSTARV